MQGIRVGFFISEGDDDLAEEIKAEISKLDYVSIRMPPMEAEWTTQRSLGSLIYHNDVVIIVQSGAYADIMYRWEEEISRTKDRLFILLSSAEYTARELFGNIVKQAKSLEELKSHLRELVKD